MNDVAQRLLSIKEQVDEAKTGTASVKGQLIGVHDQIKERFDVKTQAEAEKKLRNMTSQRAKLKKAFEKGVADLEKAYDWN